MFVGSVVWIARLIEVEEMHNLVRWARKRRLTGMKPTDFNKRKPCQSHDDTR